MQNKKSQLQRISSNRGVSPYIAILLIFSMLFIAFPSWDVYATDDIDSVTSEDIKIQEDADFLARMIKFIQLNYGHTITEEELVNGALKGMFSELDPYSKYYNTEEYNELRQDVSGDFGGLGIIITEKDGYITVISPIEGTPAFKAGIKAGDKIIYVDDMDMRNATAKKAVDLTRGEPGTDVKLGVMREGHGGILYFNITRDIIEINPITYKILGNNIGYIKISQFNDNTFYNIYKTLIEFDEENVTKIIVDLRNNPGGSLDQVIDVARLFIPKGPIVHIKNNNGQIKTYSSFIEKAPYDLAVLVNEGSASASEIFAGAVQDRKAGIIIGTTTYGKGTVQRILSLKRGGGIKLTTAEYLTANKRSIDGKGIEPDIIVQNIDDELMDRLSRIPSFDYTKTDSLDDVGLNVLAAEEILDILGYEPGKIDGVLKYKTYRAIKKFQGDRGLTAKGVLNKETQEELGNALVEYFQLEQNDKQLQKAIKVLSSSKNTTK